MAGTIDFQDGDGLTLMDNSLVWVSSEEIGWIKGRIVRKPGPGEVEVEVVERDHAPDPPNGTLIQASVEDLLPVSELDANEEPTKIGDVLNLQVLHDAAVYEILRLRYFGDNIYTQAGPTSLISINPYKQIVPLYTQRAINTYKDNTQGAAPHVFGMAQTAHNNLVDNGVCQSILCSGESGAGKTEVAKLVVQYLAATTSKDAAFKGAGGSKVNPLFHTRQVQNQIIESNPLLEAFGNAKTVRNENSSRFGKFIQILFSGDHTICGGRVRHYLLEKARVVSQHRGERNYHVFYQMCAGLHGPVRDRLQLKTPEEFNFLNQSGVYELLDTDGMPMCDEVAEFARVEKSMAQMQIDEAQQGQVWEILGAILHLGNIGFETQEIKGSDEGSTVTTPDVLETAAGLLQVPAETLGQGLCFSLVKITGETSLIQVPQPAASAAFSRDALCKVLYERLFAWLVSCVNSCLSASDAYEGLSEKERARMEGRFIGVLDIFGFEVFEHNSFEQLCINFANEALQQQFIDQMLHAMMSQYESEGVTVERIPFDDNSPCLALLETKQGVFSLLDDECAFPKATDTTFLAKLMERHGKHSHLKPGGTSSDPHLKEGGGATGAAVKSTAAAAVLKAQEAFVICHFAGEVEYSITSFLDKNRDRLNDGLNSILKASSHPLIKMILQVVDDSIEGGGGAAEAGGRVVGGRVVGGAARAGARKTNSQLVAQRQADKRSLGAQFKQQLAELIRMIESGRAHYVRCIKPNNLRRAHVFDAPQVIRQLRCSGVTETVRARRAGWPVSHPFEEFVDRYSGVYMRASGQAHPKTAEEVARFLLKSETEWRLGHTKIFLRDAASAGLEERYKVFKLSCKLLLQARVRAWLSWSKYRVWGSASVRIQSIYRMWTAVRDRKAKAVSLRRLQASLRRTSAQARLRTRASAARQLQAAMRAPGPRREFAAVKAGALCLQAGTRRESASAAHARVVSAVIAKEREEERRRREKEERDQLAAAEQERAAAEAERRQSAAAQADTAIEDAAAAAAAGDAEEAAVLLAAARELLGSAGLLEGAKLDLINQLEARIAADENRLAARAEGEQMLEAAEAAMEGLGGGTALECVEEARQFLRLAKASIDRSLSTDLQPRIAKLVAQMLAVEDREAAVLEAATAAQEVEVLLATGAPAVQAAQALTRAADALGRAGEDPDMLLKLSSKVEAAAAAEEDQRVRAEEEDAEREAALCKEEKEAEAEAERMRQEDVVRETRSKEQAIEQKKVVASQEDRLAVTLGGYGRESLGGNNESPPRPLSFSPTPSQAGPPPALEIDPPLRVLKEGWLLKQSKKLKKWQKRYFVLDNVALYYCRSPTSVPDGFFAVRRCQFHYSERTCCFDIITPSRVFRMQAPEGRQQLLEWTDCYKKAMGTLEFPYFHVEQTTRLNLSRELLLGVMSSGLRMVKLGLYDPGYEEEIEMYTFDEIYSWGASDLQTFEFRVASERLPYSFKTMHAQEIEAKLEAKFAKWRDWRLWQKQNTPAKITPAK